jgi:hypothetical protein
MDRMGVLFCHFVVKWDYETENAKMSCDLSRGIFGPQKKKERQKIEKNKLIK